MRRRFPRADSLSMRLAKSFTGAVSREATARAIRDRNGRDYKTRQQ
jgi:hypothetical protein